jgi:starch synthase
VAELWYTAADMDILFAASELAPMVKVGGLADVVAALSKALRLLGNKVTLAIPRYPALEASGLLLARRLTPMVLPSVPGVKGSERLEFHVLDGKLGSGVELLVIDFPGLFDRPGVYGEGGEDYPDNARRFGLFCRAVVEVVRQRARAGTPYDVVHAHDWPTAMVPYLLREHGAELARTRSVLTLHNLSHQGSFPASALPQLGLGTEHFTTDRLEFYGQVSFLKGGLLAASAVTTVSTTYAREILTPELGERLDGVLRSRKEKVLGIINGIDYAVWNPMTDPALAARYDAEDSSNKGRCKSALLQELGLEIQPDRPLIVSLGRIVTQKGSDVLAAALPKILKGDVSVVIAGKGDAALEAKLETAVSKSKERAAYLGGVSEPLSHRLLAAADIVVVPSRYEPCGLVQLYAQRYGALPVAARTGGLVDTIVDCDAALETGTGFLFDKPTATALTGAVQRAVAAITHPRWSALRRRVMRLDLGWDRPARRYAHVYRSILTAPPPGVETTPEVRS